MQRLQTSEPAEQSRAVLIDQALNGAQSLAASQMEQIMMLQGQVALSQVWMCDLLMKTHHVSLAKLGCDLV